MIRKKICAITGSRAEYGLMRRTLIEIERSKKLDLKLIATGAHLSKEFGYTIDEIVKDGFDIDDTVEMLLSSDSTSSIGKSLGLGIIGYADCLKRMSADIIFIVGDRYEIFAAATAAMVMNIPIAHASGGEITEGAIDEQIRHSITKMSHIHFTTEEKNSNIIRQMGEEPWRIHTVGGLWVDDLQNLKKKTRNELQKILDVNLISPVILVTYHPETLSLDDTETQINNLISALKEIDAEIIFTYPNADASGRIIITKINEYVMSYPKVKAYKSLGRTLYFSLLEYCDLVVGNSSSGMVETQSFKIPVVNIGNRQKGRKMTENIIHSSGGKKSNLSSIKKGLSKEFRNTIKNMENPYAKKGAGKEIVRILSRLSLNKNLLKKKFLFYGGGLGKN